MDTQTHIRKAVDLLGSQKKLADAIGCSQQHISLLIRGEVNTTAEMAAKIHKATGGKVPMAEIRPDVFGEAGKRRSAKRETAA